MPTVHRSSCCCAPLLCLLVAVSVLLVCGGVPSNINSRGLQQDSQHGELADDLVQLAALTALYRQCDGPSWRIFEAVGDISSIVSAGIVPWGTANTSYCRYPVNDT